MYREVGNNNTWLIQRLRSQLHKAVVENEELKEEIAKLNKELEEAKNKPKPGPKKGQQVSSRGKRILTPGKELEENKESE